MFHHDPVVFILVIYLVSKAVVLCVLLIGYLFSPEKERPSRPAQKASQALPPRLTLTLKNPRHERPRPCKHRKTALQQTVEETFSDN